MSSSVRDSQISASAKQWTRTIEHIMIVTLCVWNEFKTTTHSASHSVAAKDSWFLVCYSVSSGKYRIFSNLMCTLFTVLEV